MSNNIQRIIIIAEAGVNHNGDIDIAKKLIDIAAVSGADYVKFQTFITELSVSKSANKADYQISNTNNGAESQFEMVKKLELSFSDFSVLSGYCTLRKIGFLSTAFDSPSIDFLSSLGIPFFKVPSGELTNKPYLEHIACKAKPVILSTGMATLEEIRTAINVLLAGGLTKQMVTVLHCNTEYPTPMEDVNLLAMKTIEQELGVKVGYSDHTLGIEVPIAAAALGATVIEKHFTLDRNMPGPDHLASLEPEELKSMVTAIRNIEKAISGNGLKEPSASERKNIVIARKSIHLKSNLAAGHILTQQDLEIKRPGDGISPMLIKTIIGKRLKTDLPEEYKLSLNDIE